MYDERVYLASMATAWSAVSLNEPQLERQNTLKEKYSAGFIGH
jgi:hypothetical protein